MAGDSDQALKAYAESRGLRVGNTIKVLDGGSDTATTASVPIYSDASGKLAAAGYPFAVQLLAGVQSTSASLASLEGSSTGTANDLMHLTLVSGANATATIAGYYRLTVTDDAGNIANGAYYAPFYTLG